MDSPETLRLRYTLPDGARLVEGTELGKVGLVTIVAADGSTIGVIKPIFAVDASGRTVKAASRVEGNDLVIEVAHRSQPVEYPILVDPVTEGWSGTYWCDGGPSGGWTGENIGAPDNYWSRACHINQAGYGYGAWLGAHYGAPFNAGALYQWSWYSPANTYISDVGMNAWRHLDVHGTYGYSGIFADGAGGGWQSFHESFWGTGPMWVQHANGTMRPNRFVMGLRFHTTVYSQGALTGTDGVSLVLRDGQDPDAPTIVNHSPSSVVRSDGVREYDWSSGPTMQFKTRDIGLGTRIVAVLGDNDTYLWGPFYRRTDGTWTADPNLACAGTRANGCAKTEVTTPLSVYTGLREGDNYGKLIAMDAGGRYTFGPRINVRYSRYPTSARYGGSNRRIDSDAERGALLTALEPISRSQADKVYAGMHPSDLDSLNQSMRVAEVEVEAESSTTTGEIEPDPSLRDYQSHSSQEYRTRGCTIVTSPRYRVRFKKFGKSWIGWRVRLKSRFCFHFENGTARYDNSKEFDYEVRGITAKRGL